VAETREDGLGRGRDNAAGLATTNGRESTASTCTGNAGAET